MSFGAFYTFLFSSSQSAIGCHAKRHYIPHPVIMNTLCIGVPILTTLGGFGWGISATILTQAQREAFDSLISQLRTGHYSQAGMENYIAAAQHFILQFRWASFTWSIFALVAALVRTELNHTPLHLTLAYESSPERSSTRAKKDRLMLRFHDSVLLFHDLFVHASLEGDCGSCAIDYQSCGSGNRNQSTI